MKAFELTLKLRNNLIKKRRIEMGLTPQQAAKAAGTPYRKWLQYEAMTIYPVRKNGEWMESAKTIASFIGLPVEDIFPECVLAVKKPEVVVELDGPEMVALSGAARMPCQLPSPEEALADNEIYQVIQNEVGKLSPREAKIIRQRFGLDGFGGGDGMTIREILEHKDEGCSRTRISQIEAQALERLRRNMRVYT